MLGVREPDRSADPARCPVLQGLPLLDLRPLTPSDLPASASMTDWLAFARRLRGQFAVLAGRGAATFVVTDPVGSYPVYAHEDGAVGLSLRELAPLSRRALNPRSLVELRTHGGFVGFQSAYLDVVRLPFASVTRVEGSRRESCSYVDWLELAAPQAMTSGEALERLEATATEYLRAILAHAPGVVLLSGGTDSALVAGWIERAGLAAPALTADFRVRRYSEADAAEANARALGIDVARETVTARDFLRGFSGVNRVADGPCSNPASVVFHALAERAAARGARIAITGDHADSLFLGFDERAPLPPGWERFTTEEKLAAAFTRAVDRDEWREHAEGVDLLTLRQLPGQRWAGIGWQFSFLPIERSTGLLFVSPFYDIAMIRLGLSLPAALKVPFPVTKPLLRTAGRRLLGRELVKRASPSPARLWAGLLPAMLPRLHRSLRPAFVREFGRWIASGCRTTHELLRTTALGLWMAEHVQ
ncbi:MAG: asparagine synthase-related protein [Planctomycetes bacterium]|nr:asparagine synthase-related protein [Planctomycetota bacterium]